MMLVLKVIFHFALLGIFLPSAFAQTEHNAKELFNQFSDRIFKVRVLELSSGNQASIGSGFKTGDSGQVITNFHVISEYVHYPTRYKIVIEDRHGENFDLHLINFDVVNDLALLNSPDSENHSIPLAESLPEKGEPIYSLGNPHDLGLSVVPGTFNGVTRRSLYGRIHISGAINAGMSGGPTLDQYGRVIGVNVASSGNQVGFLVPLKHVRKFIKASESQRLKPSDYDTTVREQLFSNQQIIYKKLLDAEWKTSEFGQVVIPQEIADHVQCWGDNFSEPDQKYKYIQSDCQGSEKIFLSRDFDTGTILLQYAWIESEDLNSFQFYNLLTLEGTSMRPDNLASEDDVTNFKCHEGFVQQDHGNQPITDKAAFCAREYKKYRGLFDVMYLSMSVKHKDRTLLSHFSISGVSKETADKFLMKFFSEIAWQ